MAMTFKFRSEDEYFLAEIKGIRGSSGAIRLTDNEFGKAEDFP